MDYAQDFFGRPTYLTVSGQLEAETYASALGNVYTFGPTFRSENSNTRRHLAEFWMIEPEMAFADNVDNADLAEDYLRYLFRRLLDEQCPGSRVLQPVGRSRSCSSGSASVADQDFERITYGEAIEVLEKADVDFEFPVHWGTDLQSEHERLPDRDGVRPAGHRHRLPVRHQGLLYAP